SYRQRILDGADCRELVLQMIDQQVEQGTAHYLDRDFRWKAACDWAGQELHVEVTPSDIRDMDKEQLSSYLQDECRTQGEELIHEQIEENLPEDEDERGWNWLALSRWVNTQWGLKTTDRELKRVGRDDLQEHLVKLAFEAIDQINFDALDIFLAPDFPHRTMC